MSKRGGFPGGGGNMGAMMKQAQKMQAELARAQEEIKDMTFEATAGGGMVKVVANGDMTVDSIVIDPEAVDPEDVEMLQDMVAAAVNEALRGVSEISSQRLNAATGCSTSLSACRAWGRSRRSVSRTGSSTPIRLRRCACRMPSPR